MILIIGFGNVLRGDDGIGWLAANVVREQFEGDNEVEIVACQQLMPEQAEALSRAASAIFLDSEISVGCDLRCAQLTPVSPQPNFMTHHLNPENLLGLARALYGHSPRSFVVSVGGEAFDYGTECSPAVKDMLPEMLSLTKCLVSWAKKPETAVAVNSNENAVDIFMAGQQSPLLVQGTEAAAKKVQGG